jgi:hypothetical protein
MSYLILHKVRGEPAFDIADKLLIGDEEGWIIPTSGHRAYPYRAWHLEDLSDISDINQFGNHIAPMQYVNSIPKDWPDHYACEGTAPKSDFNIMALVSHLMPKIRRRV